MAYSWAKVYIEILDDHKMGLLPDSLWRRVIELILLAKKLDKDGGLPGLMEMSWTLRIPAEKLEADLTELSNTGIVELKDGDWFLTNFSKRQDADSSTERVREYRKRESSRQPSWQEQIYSKFPESPGIYCIKCLDTGMEYIGGSANLKQRVAQHLSEMKTNRGHPMYADFREYGNASIQADIVEVVSSTDQIKDAEIKAISSRNETKLYNHEETGKRHHSWNETGTNRSTDKTRLDTDKTRLDSRKRDPIFDAICAVCIIDPKVKGNGAKIGKARAALADSEPSYSADEILAFGEWWNSDDWRRKKGPPSVWKLTEQIGIVRNGNGKELPANISIAERAIQISQARRKTSGGRE